MTMPKEFIHTMTKKVSFTKEHTELFIYSTNVDFEGYCKDGQITVQQYMYILGKLDYIRETFNRLDENSENYEMYMNAMMHTADEILAVRRFIVETCPDKDERASNLAKALKKRNAAKA